MLVYNELLNNFINNELLKGDNEMSKSYDKLNESPEKAIQFVLAATINVYYYYKEIINRGREFLSSIHGMSDLMDTKFNSDDLEHIDGYLHLLEQTTKVLSSAGLKISIKMGAEQKIDELCDAFNICPLGLEMQHARPVFTNIIIDTIAKYNDGARDEDKVSIPYVIEILHRANDEYVYDLEKNSSVGRMPQPDDHDTDKVLKQLAISIKDACGKAIKNRDRKLEDLKTIDISTFSDPIAICRLLDKPEINLDDFEFERYGYDMDDAFSESILCACKTYTSFYAPKKKKESEDEVYIEIISPKVTPASGNKKEEEILHDIEVIARTCYKSEDKMTEDSAVKMVRNLIKSEHMAMLEHASISMIFTCDRGISHEIVRHRMASYAQESTRYCNYSKGKFGHKIKVISPMCGFTDLSIDLYKEWADACNDAAEKYFKMIDMGAAPQLARDVLPTSTATTIVVTMNIREWRHFFKLRSLGTTGAPHPQMKYLADKALEYMTVNYPVLFGDLYSKEDK